MLKSLEIYGFKSFADKTRFEFPPGVTAIVGPNGSGKSNVVDAIKWVLGEQSVKSLRGREMVDCIFNGSGGRTPLHAAEATLTFDNTNRNLAVDADEVQITRRVYRSGEGEYLINRQACRLKDIREILAGTGASTEAYCVIEQGKVDVLLQASAKDRRAIFEEAAGVSRFKAKKIESLRRLERVEQNLLRLSDIVDEVEHRLKTIRLQAAKARRYREHTSRLQELRTQVGMADWRILSENLAILEGELQQTAQEREQAIAAGEAIEAEAARVESAIAEADEAIREVEAKLSTNRERIAAEETTIDHERERYRDFEEEVGRRRRQLVAMNIRAGDVRQQLETTRQDVAVAEARRDALRSDAQRAEAAMAEVLENVRRVQAEHESLQSERLTTLQEIAGLDKEIASFDSQLASASAEQSRLQARIAEDSEAHQQLSLDVARRQLDQREAETRAKEAQAKHAAATSRLAARRRSHSVRLEELSELRRRHSGATERAAVLEELEQRAEGLNVGVKDILARIKQSNEGPWKHVHGIVADLLQGEVDTGHLVEVALGEKAQYLVVSQDEELFAFLARESHKLPGRVGFIRLQALKQDEAARPADVDLSEEQGVLGRADRFVETAPEYRVLAERLLGRTWIVERLSNALAIPPEKRQGQAFVTLAGEYLSPENTLAVGPRHALPGLISRRAELRALRGQIADLAAQIAEATTVVDDLASEIEAEEERVEQLAEEQQAALNEFTTANAALASAEQRLAALDAQRRQSEAEHAAALAAEVDARQRRRRAGERYEALRERLAEHEAALAESNARLASLDNDRRQAERESSAIQVELAKSEERLANLLARLRQFEHDQNERERALSESRAQMAEHRQRARQACFTILRCESILAEAYLQKEELGRELRRMDQEREALRAERAELAARAKSQQAELRRIEERQHAQELAASEIRHERTTLATRMQEDYGIDLATIEPPANDEEQREREAIEAEIAELRRKINNIGSVNLEALDELEGLEARYNSLSTQYNDLRQAKESLEQIIHRINADSRRLFSETLEAVKANFHTLFRKLFGGGHADIVLEEGVDILDSGIEIIARPPGKEPRNISLLSGGEKTLTCVALLLAIFQHRPSPFCVLDEVDAALDEANIERFANVLQEFLAWTQFIIVTHSKKTMTCATTLYGVTMQESGVSKRVSVSFDNVGDNGEILLRDSASSEPADETQAA